MRDRLLIRHFLWRFIEHDFISTSADRRDVFAAFGGSITALSLFLTVLVAWPYQLFPEMPPGVASLQSLDNRFMFVATSMLLAALAAVAQWDALALDARDAAVLGPLPISTSVIVRTKFIATALFAVAVLVAWNLLPTLFRAAAIPNGLAVGWGGAFRLTVAHGVATVMAGGFGFLAVLGLREATYAVLGATGFRTVSAAIQGTLVVVLITALLLLPSVTFRVAERWLANESVTTTMLPPFWFVGLHEALAGGVIDDLPRARPSRIFVEREREATELYRRVRPRFDRLAGIALGGFILAAFVAALACWWNSRRLPLPGGSMERGNSAAARAFAATAARTLVRRPLEQAGFFFALQTLSRRVSHRMIMAAALAIGLSLMLLMGTGAGLVEADDVTSIPLAVFAAPCLLIASVLIGFRHATRVPSELRASSTFGLAWPDQAVPYIAGVKRAGWTAVIAPTLAAVAIWHAALLGPVLAVLHLGVGTALSAVLMELLFLRNRRVPFASGYVPGDDAKTHGAILCAAVVCLSFAMAWVERSSMTSLFAYAALLVILATVRLCVIWFDGASDGNVVLDLDETPAPPTQRLNLAG